MRLRPLHGMAGSPHAVVVRFIGWSGLLQAVSMIPALRTPAQQLVTVFGGSGFLGRYVVRALARRGYRVLVATRRPHLAGHLQPLGVVGQIHAVQANLRDPASVA